MQVINFFHYSALSQLAHFDVRYRRLISLGNASRGYGRGRRESDKWETSDEQPAHDGEIIYGTGAAAAAAWH